MPSAHVLVFGPVAPLSRRALRLAAAVAFCVGCSSHPPTLSVSGIVRFKGEPVPGATVVFEGSHPKSGKPVIATAMTDQSGRFTLESHFGPRIAAAGALAGKHRVTITKHVPPNGMSEEQYQELVKAEQAGVQEKGPGTRQKRAPDRVPLFRDVYSNAAKTPLTAEIVMGRTNDFTFDLD